MNGHGSAAQWSVATCLYCIKKFTCGPKKEHFPHRIVDRTPQTNCDFQFFFYPTTRKLEAIFAKYQVSR